MDARSPEFEPFARKMETAGLPPVAIKTFGFYYGLLQAGETGALSRAEIVPVDSLPDLEGLEVAERAGAEALPRAVVIKLNGGLGTSMGMTRAKSLVLTKANSLGMVT